jgi:DNA gyrase subunit B
MPENDYNSSQLQQLDDAEHVRKRPAMYIGSTDQSGLHHLVYEVVDNSIDEAMAGYASEIVVTLNEDGSCSVRDDGRGIPVDKADGGKSGLELVLTSLKAGGKFDNGDDGTAYEVSGGLHGVGVSVVNFLSHEMHAEVRRSGDIWTQSYHLGTPTSEVEKTGRLDDSEETGTTITFTPDNDIFETDDFKYDILQNRLRELAFLNSGVKITIEDNRPEEQERSEFMYEGGVREFVDYLNESNEPLHEDVIYINDFDSDSNVQVEIAMQATQAVQPSINSFANNINTEDGGSHMTGFKTALTRIVNKYADETDALGDIDSLKGDDIREGLTAIISVKHPDPQFEGQTKTKLGNSEVRGIVGGALHEHLTTYLNENPDAAQRIVMKAVEAAKARKEAKRAQEVVRDNSELQSTVLPDKLADCQEKDPELAELFIVEGDSAGGSAKQGRDNESQAVLPLRGKILNVERRRLDRILENEQIKSLVKAVGAGIGDEFDVDDVRYKNIIMATDADVDGAHIRTLMLTVFYRHMKPLIENGYVYATVPPLYRIRNKGETYDAMTEEEREQIVAEKCNGNADQVQRFKGLGEMNPKQLWKTVMNPDNRKLKRITIEDAAQADKMFSVLMGEEVQPRKDFIRGHSDKAEWVDI